MSDEMKIKINRIAHKWAVRLRRADNIDHDPEGQRMKGVIAEACMEAYGLAVPEDDGKTVVVTESLGDA
jgi:hypothetical protein